MTTPSPTHTSPAFTAGPWIIRVENGSPYFHITTPENIAYTIVVIMPTINCKIIAEQSAIARLIAAAPELLLACKDAVYALNQIPNTQLDPVVGEKHKNTYSVCSMLDSLIAKAEGR